MQEIDVHEFEEWKKKGEDFQLIDVREPFEYDIVNLGGELIPMNEIGKNIDKISRDRKVIVHCKSGGRSAMAIERLNKDYGFNNLYNLRGGVLSYANEIDPSLPKY